MTAMASAIGWPVAWLLRKGWMSAIFGFALAFWPAYYLAKQPPVMVKDVDLDAKAVLRGGDLNLIYTKHESSVCMTAAVRWLWRFDPEDPLPDDDRHKRKQWRELRAVPDSPPAVGVDERIRVSIPVPLGIEPGEWHYRGVYRDNCRGLLSSMVSNTVAWFTGYDNIRTGRDIDVYIEPDFRDNTKPIR